MKFTAPDGTVFEDRTAYRKYMYERFFSFKNRENESVVKKAGDIDGQPFDLEDLSHCEVVIADQSEQVQVDNLTDCRVFVGACCSSVFVRNCSNCTFTVACKQLRTRDCVDCTFYLYSMTEPVIETSTRMLFAPFNGGYPEQGQHLRSANLDPNCNLWYEVFDFNDEAKTGDNWTLLEKSEEAAPWFPLGECEPAIPRVEPGSVAKQTDDKMHTFSIHTGLEAAELDAAEAEAEAAEVQAETRGAEQPEEHPESLEQAEIELQLEAGPAVEAQDDALAAAATGQHELPSSPAPSGRSTPELYVHYVPMAAVDDMELIRHHHNMERPQTSYARTRPNSAPPMRPTKTAPPTNAPQLSKEHLFDVVKATVRQPDMYHILQVAFGFADGPEQYDVRTEFVNIVEPGSRWVNLKGLKDAFTAARVQFTDAQVAVLATHIAEHVSTLAAAVGSEQLRQSQSSLPQQLYRHNKLWATAVRIYLVSARRSHLKRPKAWDSWWTEKQAQDTMQKLSKKVELKKALAGQDYKLPLEELDRLLEKYQIVPPDLLDREIENRLRLWRPDDGTSHKRQRAKLREQEQKTAAITKDLVQLFEQERRINIVNRQQFKQEAFLDWLRHRIVSTERKIHAKAATRERLVQRAAMEKEAEKLEAARAKAAERVKRLSVERRSSRLQQRLRDTDCDDPEKQQRLWEWELAKIREQREAKKRLAEQKKQEQEAKKRREAQAKREYKAWVKMRKKNKYFSAVAEKVYKVQHPDVSSESKQPASQASSGNKRARSKIIKEPRECWVEVPDYDRLKHPKDWQPIVPKPELYS